MWLCGPEEEAAEFAVVRVSGAAAVRMLRKTKLILSAQIPGENWENSFKCSLRETLHPG